MDITKIGIGVTSYALLRKVLEVLLDEKLDYQPIKGWAFSSWAVSILHDIIVVPTVAYIGSKDNMYITAYSYYLADFVWFARRRSFQGLLYHHLATILIISIALMYLNPETRVMYSSNILYMTVGSGILNLRGVLRATRIPNLPDYIYASLYLASRLLVITSLRNATPFELAISTPLLIHNLRIVYKLLVRYR